MNVIKFSTLSRKSKRLVFSSKDWAKELTGNSSGTAAFVPEWKGKYMIEVSRTDEEKGEHHPFFVRPVDINQILVDLRFSKMRL